MYCPKCGKPHFIRSEPQMINIIQAGIMPGVNRELVRKIQLEAILNAMPCASEKIQ